MYKLIIKSFSVLENKFNYIDVVCGAYTECLQASKQYNRFVVNWKIIKL